MFSRKLTRYAAAGAAAVVVAAGAFAIGNASSGNSTSSTPNGSLAGGPRQGPRAGQGPRSGQAPRSGQGFQPDQSQKTGQVPKGWQPGTGTIITGAAADKAKAAALAAGYKGTVNRVLRLGDGSYVVHLIATGGPHHVFVGTDFKVAGSE